MAAQNQHTRQALDALPDRGSLARAPRRAAGATGGHPGRGPWAVGVRARAAGWGRPVRPHPPTGRRSGRRPGDRGRSRWPTGPMPPRRSTGSIPRRTAPWSPSASAMADPNTPSCGCCGRPMVTRVRDVIPHTRAASVAWEPDGSGFFYTRYPDGGEYHRSVFWHGLGTPWAADPLVWRAPDEPTAWPVLELSADGRWLLVTVQLGWGRTDIHLLDRTTGGWRTLIAGDEVVTTLTFARATVAGGRHHPRRPRGRVVEVALDPAPVRPSPKPGERSSRRARRCSAPSPSAPRSSGWSRPVGPSTPSVGVPPDGTTSDRRRTRRRHRRRRGRHHHRSRHGRSVRRGRQLRRADHRCGGFRRAQVRLCDGRRRQGERRSRSPSSRSPTHRATGPRSGSSCCVAPT